MNTSDKARSKTCYSCDVCGGGNADVTHTATGELLIGCFSDSCREMGGRYLCELAEARGLKRNASKAEIAAAIEADPNSNLVGGRPPDPIPTLREIARGAIRLDEDEYACAYLDSRGISPRTRRLCRLFRTAAGIGIPVRDGGKVVNVITARLPRSSPKYTVLAGHPAALLAPGGLDHAELLLVAGAFDALIASQRGLHAVAATCGASLPLALLPRLSGRRVAVAYDVGEELAAERTLAKLVAAGIDAWVVRLPMPEKGDDLSDWFNRYCRTNHQLRGLIRRSR